ncbi:hypothetical protein ACFQZI_13570 [Mucilaginibacter lutimaris]|uniref:PH domain-containing protein n=1 Tax=Mucilaginibacter lutimaris TaxID=931629 RepID=A0ABW2ZI56_9SPHI
MQEYKYTAEGNAKLKKAWMYSMIFSYIGIVSIFAFNLLYRGGDTRDIIIFSVIVAAMIMGFVYGRKKYFKGVDATKLIIDDKKITLHTLNQPDVTINLDAIMKVTHRNSHLFLVNRNPKNRSMLIINKFEGFYEIERLVNDAVATNNLQPTIV